MKRIMIFSVMLVTLAFGQAVLKSGDVRLSPRLLNYQGYLTDTLGNPITNPTVSMIFSVYDAASAGNSKWTETQPAVSVSKGIFSVLLGSVTAIPDSVFNNPVRWLELSVAGQTLAPRTRIVSAPYAYTATYSDTALYARNSAPDNDWSFRVTDGADTTLQMGGRWGLARPGNVLYGNADSTHVNLGVSSTTGTSGQNYKYCTVAGGSSNTAKGYYSTVGGGRVNTAGMYYATVGGGYANNAIGHTSTVSGGYYNYADSNCATVAGGRSNFACNNFATVSGGDDNQALAPYANVGGGWSNLIQDAEYSTIGGGYNNLAQNGFASTVGGGCWNTTQGNYATVGGGHINHAQGLGATVAGGEGNFIYGLYSAILGGYADTIFAGANYSYLFGINSNLTQDSTFMVDLPHVWFGTEANGYEFPRTRGSNGQVMVTNGSGQLSWSSIPAPADTDWVISGNNQYSGVSGNVGVGTTTPERKLSVNGDIRWGTQNALTTDQGGSIELGYSSGSATTPFIDFHYGVGSVQDYNMRIINDANGRLRVSGQSPQNFIVDGNVGVGTTTPAQKLDVAGDAKFTGGDAAVWYGNKAVTIRQDGDNTYISNKYNFVANGADTNGAIVINGSKGVGLYYGDAGSCGTAGLALNSTGNVGIGTTAPARTLHVSDVMRLSPRATAPSSPAEGDIYMDGTTHKLMVYDGSAWRACW